MANHYTRVMFYRTYFIILILFCFKCRPIFGKLSQQKSSLTFVIDDTNSMSDEINQVKSTAKSILDTVLNSKESQIENFVLVTFNDPGIKPAFVTTNKEEYIRALDGIVVQGGGDCPEMAMKGIEEALVKSLPRSYLFVFTDASAKDYGNFPSVKSLAQKMSSQIVFVLTGICETEMDPAYQVYHQLARATSGQVFHLEKNEVNKILDYVKEIVKGPRAVIEDKEFGPGYDNKIDFKTDDKIEDIIVSISGNNPKVNVLDPHGEKADTVIIIQTTKVLIIKIIHPKPGIYTITVGSQTKTTVIITGGTEFNFIHGFSTLKPASIEDTTTRPIAGKLSYLAIETDNPTNDVELNEVNLVDLNNKVLQVLPLHKVHKDFYVTVPVLVPDTMFKILVKGFIIGTKIAIQRFSATPVEPQKPSDGGAPAVKPPIITSVGDKLVKIIYGNPLELRCKVSGYPKPRVMWVEEKSGHKLSEMVEEVELPYEYVSVLKIDHVKTNIAYQCRAFNDYGEDRKAVTVEVITKFDVVDVSKDISILYEAKGSLKCDIDAIPPAHITWYKNGTSLNKDDKDIELTSDSSVLTIKKMQPRLEGKYTCEAKNELKKQEFLMQVTMADKAVPKLQETAPKVEVKQNESVDINCKVVGGVPPPKIRWSFKQQGKSDFVGMSDTSDVIHIPVADVDKSGIYRCEAYNAYGNAIKDTTLTVLYPPKIKPGETTVTTQHGKNVNLHCDVSGLPPPTVKWSYNGKPIEFTHTIFKNNTLSFKASFENAGNYTCEANNPLGSTKKAVQVIVNGAPIIKPPAKTTLEKYVGCSLTLTCDAIGFPKPVITWKHLDKDSKTTVLRTKDDSGSYDKEKLVASDSGSYTCIATNSFGTATITYTVKVLSPPTIIKSPDKEMMAVIDDLVLDLPCKAIGNPKPDVAWTKDGFFIPAGVDCHTDTMYEVKEDGTLTITDINMSSKGTYMCVAENDIGVDIKLTNLDVLKFPPPGKPEKTIKVEIGTSPKIYCDIPHTRTDILKWYKDSKVVATGELTLDNVQLSDHGIYTCRVNTLSGSTSVTVSVEVGSKPKFIYDEGGDVDFYLGEQAYLSCSAHGEPVPKVLWKFNDKTLDVTTMVLSFVMREADIGRYNCEVTNNFGTITREYNIVKAGS